MSTTLLQLVKVSFEVRTSHLPRTMSTLLLPASDLVDCPASAHDLQTEVERLYGLSNRWLAQALLTLSRTARRAAPALRPDDTRLDSRLVWDITPEIARRLGATRFLPLEAHADFAQMSLRNLRSRLAECLCFTGQYRASGTAWALLTLPAEKGNVVAFALDRLCAMTDYVPDDSDDLLCRSVATACLLQQKPLSTAWRPDIRLEGAEPLGELPVADRKTTFPSFQTGFPG